MGHLLTVAEYAALGETESGYTALLEGRRLMSPSRPAGFLPSDAGSPHYWIVDLDEPVSLLDCHLAEGFGYQDGGSVTGVFTTTEPFPVRLRLDQLLC